MIRVLNTRECTTRNDALTF